MLTALIEYDYIEVGHSRVNVSAGFGLGTV